MTDQLRQAAQAVIKAWDNDGSTQTMEDLRAALEQQAEPVQEQKYEKRIAPYSTTLSMLLNTTPPQQQAEPPPEWPLIKNILDEYGLQAISFVADWKAAQRPWVGLTPDEVKHLYELVVMRSHKYNLQKPWVDLTNEDWEQIHDKKDTSLDTFAHGAAWAADQLKERNT